MGSIFSSRKNKAESLISTFHSEKDWEEHWKTNQNSTKLMVIHFTASWCGPCRFIEPVIKEFAAKFIDVMFAKIDIDELPKGTEVDKVVGANKEELEKKIEEQRF
ncbi:Thioredoxin H2-1 [Acorus calamus]|uniref:Thioredoxin H2-1 n=1 Tax=Acorus calamus TaxID=4465 RepID=A0AAV9DL66_ACOCL|nr:Thioredoxin H2-1 [Acorus calamus]